MFVFFFRMEAYIDLNRIFFRICLYCSSFFHFIVCVSYHDFFFVSLGFTCLRSLMRLSVAVESALMGTTDAAGSLR